MPVNVKVSVVVAVYNPGPNINGLISSLNAQSLDPAELEVVFVDDGSTDGTPERLADVARDHQNFVVTTIPNSGWPGRPRNVGTALARGEYVFYADHDDEFFPEALERMYAMAVAERSDIVYGKIVRSGRSTPYWSLAQANLANADVMHAVASRTVHKLYRREFLSEHQIRFPEGRVRLEDHNFMAQALPHARVVSVLADYPCYRWIHRSDGTNNSNAKVDRRKYWEYYGGVLRTMETSSGPGPLLDATRVTAIMQAFSRFSPRSYLQQDPADRAITFDALHEIVIEHFPPELDERIPVLKRLRVQALRSGERTRFEQQQRCRTKMQFGLSDAQVAWVDGRVVVGLDASAVSAKGVPLAMDRLGDDLALPAKLGAPTGAAAARCVLTTTERGTGEITIRHREIGIEWPVESVEHQKAPRTGDKATLRMHVDGTVDPARSIFGRELETGIWDVLIRMQFLGENQVRRVPVDARTRLPEGPQQVEGRQVLVYRTQSGTLALKISADATPVGVLTAGWDTDHLVVALDAPASGTDTQLVVRRRQVDGEQLVAVQDGRARIVLGPSVRGDIFDFWLRTPAGLDGHRDQRLAYGAAQVSQRPPYRTYATVHGSFSVKHVDPSATPPRTPTRTPALAQRARVSEPDPAADTADLSLHFPLNTLALQRGGLVKSVIRRANHLAASGSFAAIWIEVLAYQQLLESDVAALKRSGHLHERVQVRSVLYSLDPSPENQSGTTTEAAVAQSGVLDQTGLVAVPSRTDHLTVRYLRDGVFEASATRDANGALRFVDHYDAGRRRVSRHEHGPDGRLIRVLHYPSTHEQPTVTRYIGRNGACFLTVWQEPGEQEWSQVHLLAPQPRQLREMGELYRYAFEQLLAGERSPVLFADFRENLYNLPVSNLDDVVGSVRHPGLRTVAMAHSNHHARPYTKDAGVSATWERLFTNLDHWDLLVLLTDGQRRDVQAHYGDGTRMRVIPPSAETAETAQAPPGAVDPDRLVLVARTHPKKRVDEALRAFRLVLDRRPSARLEIYGFGYEDREERKIDQLVDELDLREHVVFAGFASRQSDIYDGACASLMTSASEGFPLTLLESMAHGVPVIAYDANYGPSEAIIDDVNGYLVPFGDQAAIADRVVSVMESAAVRERLGAGALASLQRFDLSEHVGLWRQALADLDGPPAVRSYLRADYEVQAARWLEGELELHVGVPADAASPHLVVRQRGGAHVQQIPVVAGRACVALGAGAPGDIFDFSLAPDPGATEQRLTFGSPDVVQCRPYRIYSTTRGNFSVKHLASPRPGQLTAQGLRRAVSRFVRRAVSRFVRRG